jgi:hemolysin activation/secretion protein
MSEAHRRLNTLVGSEVSLAEIRRAVQALQADYDAAGYALARVVLPRQALRNG